VTPNVETTLVLGTDYNLSGAGDLSGGNLTTIGTLVSGEKITIERNAEYTQSTDYEPFGRFPAETLEKNIDKLTMLIQQVKSISDRSFTLNPTTSFLNRTIEEPVPGEYPKYDANGNIINGGTSVEVTGNYTYPDTNAVTRTVTNKLSDFVSILDFGGKGDSGTTDNTTPYNNAIAALASKGGGTLYIPEGNYYFMSRPNSITQGVSIVGDGKSNTILTKDYIESTDTNGFIDHDVTNNGSFIRDLQIYNNKSGGSGISIIATATDCADFVTFQNLYITGNGTNEWKYPVYVDGDLRTGSPQGCRDLRILNCDLFEGELSVCYIKAFNNLTIAETGIFATGTSNSLDLLGGSSVNSNYANVGLTFCTTVNLAIGSTANQLNIRCPFIVNVNNSANAYNCIVTASVTNGQTNWANSLYVTPEDLNGTKVTMSGDILTTAGKIYGRKSTVNSNIGYAGSPAGTSMDNGETMSFTIGSAKLFTVNKGGGQAGLFFADYVSSTISILSNPSSVFQNSAVPASGKIGVHKSANSQDISITTNTGGTETIDICVLGQQVTSIADPA